jgi:hypothetical protein
MDNDRREDEKRRREAAQASVGEVQPGGHEVVGRSLKQMVSVRLEAQLLKELRELAEQRGESISDLLRQAAVELIERSRPTAVLLVLRPTTGQQAINTSLTAGKQATSGVATSSEDWSGTGSVSSGSEHVQVAAG